MVTQALTLFPTVTPRTPRRDKDPREDLKTLARMYCTALEMQMRDRARWVQKCAGEGSVCTCTAGARHANKQKGGLICSFVPSASCTTGLLDVSGPALYLPLHELPGHRTAPAPTLVPPRSNMVATREEYAGLPPKKRPARPAASKAAPAAASEGKPPAATDKPAVDKGEVGKEEKPDDGQAEQGEIAAEKPAGGREARGQARRTSDSSKGPALPPGMGMSTGRGEPQQDRRREERGGVPANDGPPGGPACTACRLLLVVVSWLIFRHTSFATAFLPAAALPPVFRLPSCCLCVGWLVVNTDFLRFAGFGSADKMKHAGSSSEVRPAGEQAAGAERDRRDRGRSQLQQPSAEQQQLERGRSVRDDRPPRPASREEKKDREAAAEKVQTEAGKGGAALRPEAAPFVPRGEGRPSSGSARTAGEPAGLPERDAKRSRRDEPGANAAAAGSSRQRSERGGERAERSGRDRSGGSDVGAEPATVSKAERPGSERQRGDREDRQAGAEAGARGSQRADRDAHERPGGSRERERGERRRGEDDSAGGRRCTFWEACCVGLLCCVLLQHCHTLLDTSLARSQGLHGFSCVAAQRHAPSALFTSHATASLAVQAALASASVRRTRQLLSGLVAVAQMPASSAPESRRPGRRTGIALCGAAVMALGAAALLQIGRRSAIE